MLRSRNLRKKEAQVLKERAAVVNQLKKPPELHVAPAPPPADSRQGAAATDAESCVKVKKQQVFRIEMGEIVAETTNNRNSSEAVETEELPKLPEVKESLAVATSLATTELSSRYVAALFLLSGGFIYLICGKLVKSELGFV
jgi:hypothetical protein